MINKQLTAGTASATIGLLDIANKYRARIVGGAAVAAALTFAISLFVPDSYTSEATILNPSRTFHQSGLGTFLGIQQMPPGLTMAVSLMKSRVATERLIKQFDLEQVYNETDQDELLRQVQKDVSITQGKDGIIKITARASDPVRAASMANALVEILRDMLSKQIVPKQELVVQGKGSRLLGEISGLVAATEALMPNNLVYILDEARPPKKPNGPKRVLLAAMGALMGLFAMFLFAVFFEFRAGRVSH